MNMVEFHQANKKCKEVNPGENLLSKFRAPVDNPDSVLVILPLREVIENIYTRGSISHSSCTLCTVYSVTKMGQDGPRDC